MIRCSDDKAGHVSNVNGMEISFLKSPMVAATRHPRNRRVSTNYSTSIAAASASPLFSGQVTRDSFGPNFYKDVCNSLFWQSDCMRSNFHVVIQSYCQCLYVNYGEYLTLLVSFLHWRAKQLTDSHCTPSLNWFTFGPQLNGFIILWWIVLIFTWVLNLPVLNGGWSLYWS